MKNLELVSEILEEMVKKYPEDYMVFLNRGEWDQKNGRSKDALENYKKGLELMK